MQALVACTRYEEAQEEAQELLPGADALYLQAEASWRAGDVASALGALGRAVSACPGSAKCLDRQRWLQTLQETLLEGDQALEEGLPPPLHPHLIPPSADSRPICTGL